MSKILVVPSSLDDLETLSSKNIAGLIFSIKDLSVNNSLYITLDELKNIKKNLNPKLEIVISLNKIMHNKDLDYLEHVLIELANLHIKKILFYDLSVANITKRLNLDLDLVVAQDHLNASINSHKFYYNRGIKYSLITNDITIDEILDINTNSNMNLMLTIYGYLPIFYSRRYLLSNYFEYLNQEKTNNNYYLASDNNYYPIIEEKEGTTIYTPSPLNLTNYKDKLSKLSYVIFNSNYLPHDKFHQDLDNYLSDNPSEDNNNYTGFANIKTIYKVKNNE